MNGFESHSRLHLKAKKHLRNEVLFFVVWIYFVSFLYVKLYDRFLRFVPLFPRLSGVLE